MGLFDSIYLKMECPYCGKVSTMEFQTKDGKCCMNTYKKGMIFDKGRFRKIDAIGTCESLTCQLEAAKESVWKWGYYGGFSRSFEVYIDCDENGKITDKIKVYKLNNHKGIMHGKLGELKGKDDNMRLVKPIEFKKEKISGPVMKKITTDGWLDKFKEDSFFEGEKHYRNILYLFNLEDGEEAMKKWFLFRHGLDRIIEILKKEFKIKKDEELASVFLSNEPYDMYSLGEVQKE